MKKLILVISLLFFTFNTVKATHLMGGEITWECIKVGPDAGKYIFNVKVYRDCQGVAILTSMSLAAHNVPGISTIPLSYIGANDISPSCNTVNGPNTQFSCGGTNIGSAGNGNGAVEEHIYRSAPISISGTPDANGWHFTWSSCCRNAAISNGMANEGFTLRAVMYSFIDSSGQVLPRNNECYDSSPKFFEKPRTILEVGNGYDPLAFSNGFTYSHNAFDEEQDSISYTWGKPLDNFGYDYLNPNSTALIFNAPYSFSNPINGIVMNSQTGRTWYPANQQGNFVTCTKVAAFKCGQLVSEVFREIQVVLVPPICNLGDTTNGNIGADTLCNVRPSVQPPFFYPSTPAPYQWDTLVHCGDTVKFDFNAIDNDIYPNGSQQDLLFEVSGGQFYDYFNNIPCQNPPCATFNEIGTGSTPPFITSGGSGSGEFEWITSCNHVVNTCGADLQPTVYTFVIKVSDDFCPAPAIENTSQVISITVYPPCGSSLKANSVVIPESSCGTGDASISVSPNGGFPPYISYYFDMNGLPVNPNALFPGDYQIIITDVSLCEIIDTVTVPGPVSTSVYNNYSICNGDSIVVGANSYFISGSYTDILTAINGCDSIINTSLIVNMSSTSTDTQVACDTYTWLDGVTYIASDSTATWTTINASGCDNVATLNLTLNNSTTSTDTQVACDTYTWLDGVTYTASNSTATFTSINAAGCTNVATLDLTFTNSTTSTDTQVACDTYTWLDGVTYTSSDSTATFTSINAAGCNNVATLDLTITNSSITTNNQNICFSGSYIINGNTYYTSGIYIDTLTSSNGCDSIVTTNLTIGAAINIMSNISQVSCNGYTDGSINITTNGGSSPYTYLWSNGIATQSISNIPAGTYTLSVSDANNCITVDSLIVTEPSALQTSITNNNGVITGNTLGGSPPYIYEFFGPNGLVASSSNNFGNSFSITPINSGNYSFIVVDANGCSDSMSINFALNFSPSVSVMLSNTDCDSLADLTIIVSQDSGEVDMSTALFQSNAGYFDIMSMNVGDTIGTSTMMSGGGSLNLSAFLIVGSIISTSQVSIHPCSPGIQGCLGTFIITNSNNGGIELLAQSVPDNNNYTNGNMSSITFNNVFVNPCIPLVFTSTINSELGDVDVQIINFTISSLDEIDNFNIVIHPNPSNGRLTLEMSNVILGDYVIEIRSLLGVKVYNENVKIQDVYKMNIDISSYGAGTYLISVYNSKGRLTKKLIIK
tara:strand:+ start:309 stop:3977 length:3669 start_codon:yes stop_codon:yes gene_type:complete